jgi:Tol biopolymer transport system component
MFLSVLSVFKPTSELIQSRISTKADGMEVDGFSYEPQFSPDGRYVVFDSYATNLVAGDSNQKSDIFLKDLSTGAVTCISSAATGIQGDQNSFVPRFSLDGRHVVFESDATNLVANDGNGKSDIFLVNLFYKANAAAIVEGRFIETTLGVGNASSVSVA